MNLDTLNRGELLAEIMDLAREQGISNQQEWNDLVDEVIDAHMNLGEMNDDQDVAQISQALYMGYEEYKEEAGQESAGAISEDPEAPMA